MNFTCVYKRLNVSENKSVYYKNYKIIAFDIRG